MIDADVLENTPNFQGKPYGWWRHFRSKGSTRAEIAQLPLHMRTSFQCGYCAIGCACAYPRNPLRGTSCSPVGHAHILYYCTYFRVRPGTLLVTWLTSLPITWLPVAPPPQIWFEIISNYNMETPKKRLNKYWYSVPHYLSDIRNIYIKADRFPFMMLTAANKERKQI
jgi:hypothetical protein